MSEANSREQKQREDTGGRVGIVEDDEEEDEEKEGKEEEEEETSQTKKMTDSCENKSDARRSKTNTKRLDRDARARTHAHAHTVCLKMVARTQAGAVEAVNVTHPAGGTLDLLKCQRKPRLQLPSNTFVSGTKSYRRKQIDTRVNHSVAPHVSYDYCCCYFVCTVWE